MEIRRYCKDIDVQNVMSLLQEEGETWSCYWNEDRAESYKQALTHSITFVAYEGNQILGYARALDDHGFYVYLCDLLVRKADRGNQLGRKLIEAFVIAFPRQNVYVMSDEDGYYHKLNFDRIGSIYEVRMK